MYRIDVHLKQDAQPDADLRHLSYDALKIDVQSNTIYIQFPNEQIKAFNMDRVSYFRVHKSRGYGLLEQDGKYYKLFAINVNGDKYYCIGAKYNANIIQGFRSYKNAMEAFKNAEKYYNSPGDKKGDQNETT